MKKAMKNIEKKKSSYAAVRVGNKMVCRSVWNRMISSFLIALTLLLLAVGDSEVKAAGNSRHLLECQDSITVCGEGALTVYSIPYDDIPTITLYCDIADSSIAELSWGSFDEDNYIDLYIHGKKSGTTTIYITDDYNDECKAVALTVTMNGSSSSGDSECDADDPLVGTWSEDPQAEQPIYIRFYRENGEMKWEMYQMVTGNGNGFNRANEKTKFEYSSGYVEFKYDGEYAFCVCESSGKYYKMYYLAYLNGGIIYDAEEGGGMLTRVD